MIEFASAKNSKEPTTRKEQNGVQIPRSPKTPTPPKK
jgi:hypothetical protein